MMKTWIDRLKRHAFLIIAAILSWKIVARAETNETLMLFIAVSVLCVILTALLLHALSHIKWTDWEGNDEFEKVGKAIVIAAMVLAPFILAASFFSQHEQTTAIGTMNEEIGDKGNHSSYLDSVTTKQMQLDQRFVDSSNQSHEAAQLREYVQHVKDSLQLK